MVILRGVTLLLYFCLDAFDAFDALDALDAFDSVFQFGQRVPRIRIHIFVLKMRVGPHIGQRCGCA
jgi:hypothetical protein